MMIFLKRDKGIYKEGYDLSIVVGALIDAF